MKRNDLPTESFLTKKIPYLFTKLSDFAIIYP
jgi:hypothetical protein